MSCYHPIANCNPRCYARDYKSAGACSGCKTASFPDNWVSGCSKSEWDGWQNGGGDGGDGGESGDGGDNASESSDGGVDMGGFSKCPEGFDTEMKTDYPGNDLRCGGGKSLEQTAIECKANSQCKGFSVTTGDVNDWIKSRGGGLGKPWCLKRALYSKRADDNHAFCVKKDVGQACNPGRCGPKYSGCKCDLPTRRYCNENNGWCGNTDAHKNAQASEKYDFDGPEHDCMDGYEKKVGDISGFGYVTVGGQRRGGGETVEECDECGELCSDIDACLSYECSPTQKKCNLNVKRLPERAAYLDFAFCAKEETNVDWNSKCLGENRSCAGWMKTGYCTNASYIGYMNRNCPAHCGGKCQNVKPAEFKECPEGFDTEVGVDYPGNDILPCGRMNLQQASAKCRANPQCKGFSVLTKQPNQWIINNGGGLNQPWCLKRALPRQTKVPDHTFCVYSARKEKPAEWEKDYDRTQGACRGGKSPQANAGLKFYRDVNCPARCQNDPTCTGFVFPKIGNHQWCETYTSEGAKGDGRSSFWCFMKKDFKLEPPKQDGYITEHGACRVPKVSGNAGLQFFRNRNCAALCSQNRACTGFVLPMDAGQWCETYTSQGIKGDGRKFWCFVKEPEKEPTPSPTESPTTKPTDPPTPKPASKGCADLEDKKACKGNDKCEWKDEACGDKEGAPAAVCNKQKKSNKCKKLGCNWHEEGAQKMCLAIGQKAPEPLNFTSYEQWIAYCQKLFNEAPKKAKDMKTACVACAGKFKKDKCTYIEKKKLKKN